MYLIFPPRLHVCPNFCLVGVKRALRQLENSTCISSLTSTLDEMVNSPSSSLSSSSSSSSAGSSSSVRSNKYAMHRSRVLAKIQENLEGKSKEEIVQLIEHLYGSLQQFRQLLSVSSFLNLTEDPTLKQTSTAILSHAGNIARAQKVTLFMVDTVNGVYHRSFVWNQGTGIEENKLSDDLQNKRGSISLAIGGTHFLSFLLSFFVFFLFFLFSFLFFFFLFSFLLVCR